MLVGSSPDTAIYRVDHDHRAACAGLTRQLLTGGQELALLGEDRQLYVTQDRLQGFLDDHREAGVAVREDRLYFELSSPERVETALDAALSSGVSCLVCMDDRICAMALSLLRDRKGVSCGLGALVSLIYATAPLGFVPAAICSGERRDMGRVKYAYYAFYPVMLALLVLWVKFL